MSWPFSRDLLIRGRRRSARERRRPGPITFSIGLISQRLCRRPVRLPFGNNTNDSPQAKVLKMIRNLRESSEKKRNLGFDAQLSAKVDSPEAGNCLISRNASRVLRERR